MEAYKFIKKFTAKRIGQREDYELLRMCYFLENLFRSLTQYLMNLRTLFLRNTSVASIIVLGFSTYTA